MFVFNGLTEIFAGKTKHTRLSVIGHICCYKQTFDKTCLKKFLQHILVSVMLFVNQYVKGGFPRLGRTQDR